MNEAEQSKQAAYDLARAYFNENHSHINDFTEYIDNHIKIECRIYANMLAPVEETLAHSMHLLNMLNLDGKRLEVSKCATPLMQFKYKYDGPDIHDMHTTIQPDVIEMEVLKRMLRNVADDLNGMLENHDGIRVYRMVQGVSYEKSGNVLTHVIIKCQYKLI